jgi:DNA-binding MarR family transcriptional regulator
MTDRLLAAGYITRAVDPSSRRQNVLALTEKGGRLLDGIAKAWAAVDAMISAALGTNAAAFFAQAQHLRNTLGGVVPGATRASKTSDQ